MNASGVVPSIKSDRAGGPWVELWGDWLNRVDVPECTLALPLGDMGGVMFTVLTWALELEFAEMDKPRRKKAHVKGLDLYPLIWADKNMCPHRPDKTRLSPKRRN